MAFNSARIDSPEVIKDFRVQFLKFNETCRQAVSDARSDSQRVLYWLEHEQLHYWKQELRKREEAVAQCKSAYLLARFGSAPNRKQSFIDEERALRRAQQKKEEAEQKIRLIKKWIGTVEQQADKMLGPINMLGTHTEQLAPKALARLEQMVQSLEEYLRIAPPDASGR